MEKDLSSREITQKKIADTLDYLGENYNTASEDSPYGSFLGIVTRELDRRFDERSR